MLIPGLCARRGSTADLPPGYPQEYVRVVTLRDGRSVLIRPIHAR